MSPIRRLLVALSALPILLIAVVLALPYLLSLDSIRDRILGAVESSLHRKVEARAIHLELLYGLGARIEGVTVRNPPGWETPALATIDELSVKLALWPLLSRRVEVRRIVLEGVTVAIERNPAGELNFADLGASHHLRASPPPAAGAVDFAVSRVQISRGRFLFVDRQISPGKTVTISLDDLAGEICDLGPASTPCFDLSGRFLADAGRNIFLKGAIGPPSPGKGFADAPFEAIFAARSLALARIAPYFGAARKIDPGVLSIEGALHGSPRGVVNVTGDVALVPPPRSTRIPPFEAKLALTLDGSGDSVAIAQSPFALASLPLRAEGRIDGLRTTAPRLDLRIATPGDVAIETLARLPGFSRSLPPGMQLSGRVRLDTSLQGTPTDLSTRASLDAAPLSVSRAGEPVLAAPAVRATLLARRNAPISGRVTASAGRLQKLPFDELVADWSWNEGALTLSPELRAFGGVLSGRFESNFADPKGESRIRLEVQRVQAGRLAESFPTAGHPLSGTLTAKMSLASRGLAPDALSKTGRGEGRILLANADLKTVELMPKVASALSTIGRVAGFQVPGGFESTRFKTLDVTVRLTEGRVLTPGLSLSGQDVAVTADGWIGFDQTLSYEGRLVIGPGILRGFGAAGRRIADELGRVTLPFRVSGMISEPKVDVDYSVALDLVRRVLPRHPGEWVKGIAGKVVEHVRERMEGRGPRLPDFLRQLFSRPIAPPAEQ